MKKLLNRVRKAFIKKQPSALFTASAEPYCVGCEQNLPTFKIGKYVYHIHSANCHSGCNTK